MPHGETKCAAVAKLARWRRRPSVTLLNDGTVLIAGGKQRDDAGFLADVDRFDPKTKSIKPAAKLRAARAGHRAAVAGDGRVVVAGGRTTKDIEVYDPKADRWTKVGKTESEVVDPVVITLASGDVLIAGGDLMWKGAMSDEALVWETATGKLRKVHKLADGLMGYFALRLAGGVALVGQRPTYSSDVPEIQDAMFDEAKGTWRLGHIDDPTARTLKALLEKKKDGTAGQLLRFGGGAPLVLWTDLGMARELYAFDGKHASHSMDIVRQLEAGAALLDDHTVVAAGGDAGQTNVVVCTLGV